MVSLLAAAIYPVYKTGAPVTSDDLNKANDITKAALNHLHDEVTFITEEYKDGALKGATFTPYYHNGNLCFSNDKYLENPDPFPMTAATFTPSIDELGNLSWSNNAGLPNPETVNIKGPTGDGATTVAWAGVNGKPTTISGYGISDAFTKTEINNLIAGLQNQVTALTTRVSALEAALTGKMNNSRVVVSTANPSGGTDGDVWVKVI